MNSADPELVLLLALSVAGMLWLARWASHSRRRAVALSVGLALYVAGLAARILATR